MSHDQCLPKRIISLGDEINSPSPSLRELELSRIYATLHNSLQQRKLNGLIVAPEAAQQHHACPSESLLIILHE